MTTPIRWGILGTANIGRKALIPAILANEGSVLAGIASRDRTRAEAFIAENGWDTKAYGSYEAMLDDPDIDAVYNPLPNHLHVSLTLEAARRGKHVLCEKPIAPSKAEAGALRDLPDGIHVMEAFMIRFHPQWLRVREMIRGGRLGRVTAVQVMFSYYNDDPANIRNMADIGGGGLLDIGCYPMVVGRWVFEGDPARVVALVERDPTFGTDRLASALMDFGSGRQLAFTVSTQMTPMQRAVIMGTEGRVEVMIPFNAPKEGTEIVFTPRQGEAETIDLGPVDQYERQVEAMNRAIRGEAPLPYGVADAFVNMAILDAFVTSEKTGGWAAVKL
ncbi:MAG: Gfo/Idh/MocA family oxidoreductase [Azospirillaceae bacterium]